MIMVVAKRSIEWPKERWETPRSKLDECFLTSGWAQHTKEKLLAVFQAYKADLLKELSAAKGFMGSHLSLKLSKIMEKEKSPMSSSGLFGDIVNNVVRFHVVKNQSKVFREFIPHWVQELVASASQP